MHYVEYIDYNASYDESLTESGQKTSDRRSHAWKPLSIQSRGW